MKKGIILKIDNQKGFIYFQIEADVSVVYILDEISSSLDKYDEGLSYPNKDVEYSRFVPKRESYHDGHGTIHAIAVYNKDLIDLILFKQNSNFNKFIRLMRKNFVYADGKSF